MQGRLNEEQECQLENGVTLSKNEEEIKGKLVGEGYYLLQQGGRRQKF